MGLSLPPEVLLRSQLATITLSGHRLDVAEEHRAKMAALDHDLTSVSAS